MFEHTTVLLNEAVHGLNVKEDGTYVDCTLGGAGHSSLIASKLGNEGRLISFDQDSSAIETARERLNQYRDKVTLVKSNFLYIKDVLSERGISKVDGIVFDLGVSSPQLDEEDRGFSYRFDSLLDMRMDMDSDLTAEILINTWSEEELAKIIFTYGEEKFARRIAKKIVERRTLKPVETTGELVEIIKDAIPAPARRTGPHPAKRTFQAIRIAVNDELNSFEETLHDAIQLLNPGGRISVITFHSLEDRICKRVYSDYAKGCICPPDFPICTCGRTPSLKIITKKPILPSNQELEDNSRARSAKLRIAEKI